jgi:hypothetical protein
MVSIYGVKTNLANAQKSIGEAMASINQLNEVTEDVDRVEFYAHAFFEAEERTQWIVDVILNIVGKNQCEFKIRVDRETVWKQPRYSYREWKQQRESDREAAQKVLDRMFE